MRSIVVSFATLLLAARIAGDECTAVTIEPAPARIAWRTTGPTINLAVDGDAVFVETRQALAKVDGSDGSPIWTYAFVEEPRTPDFVVLPDRIAIVRDDRYVAFLNGSTGEEVGRTDAGEWIQHLVGPPVLAVTHASDSATSALVRMTRDGTILASRMVPHVTDARVVGDVAVVELERGRADPELQTMTGYDLATLEPLWSEQSFTFNVQVVDGFVYLGDIFWSKGATAIEPRSGAVDALVPARDPFAIGGSGEFDLQVVDSKWSGAWSPDFATCEGLRRNDPRTGGTMWRTDLPFHVSATLRDGPRLYVSGGRDPDHLYLLVLDWSTGKVERAWSGAPKMSRLEKLHDLVLGFDLENELVAIDVE